MVAAQNREGGDRTARRPGRRTAGEVRPGREELAAIALELFAERNFASVSIRDIGRAAKVNSAMIYYYFQDKEDLFRAALKSAVHEAFELFSIYSSRARDHSAAEAIDAWFDVHVSLHRRLRNVIKISVDSSTITPKHADLDDPVKEFYRREGEILRGIIKQGIDRGDFRPVDPAGASTMISTILDGALTRTFILEDFEMEKTIEEFKASMWLYLTARPETEPAEPHNVAAP